MSEVEAIKDPQTIALITRLLELRFGQPMADVWALGLNLALRISDLLAIRFEHIHGDRLIIIESKTGKLANIALNERAQAIIERIHQQHPLHVYLFQSHRSANRQHCPPKPLSRRAVSQAFASVGQELHIHLGTHSMRKTRGYQLYQRTGDLGRVMKMLRHSSQAVTLRYIGMEQAQIDDDFRQLEL